jgi:hypothetical protein
MMVCYIPEPSKSFSLDSYVEEENTSEETLQPPTYRDPEVFLNITFAEPYMIIQKELSDIIIYLELSKNKQNCCLLRLQMWNILDKTVKVTAFHSCRKYFEHFFIMQGELRPCKNVEVLIAGRNIKYNPSEWQLFIDFYAWPKSSVVAQSKHTACNPSYLWYAQKKKKGNT